MFCLLLVLLLSGQLEAGFKGACSDNDSSDLIKEMSLCGEGRDVTRSEQAVLGARRRLTLAARNCSVQCAGLEWGPFCLKHSRKLCFNGSVCSFL